MPIAVMAKILGKPSGIAVLHFNFFKFFLRLGR